MAVDLSFAVGSPSPEALAIFATAFAGFLADEFYMPVHLQAERTGRGLEALELEIEAVAASME